MAAETTNNVRGVIYVMILALFPTVTAKATLVDSNSIVEYGIEYYIQTDKSTYSLGENVEMFFKVTNLTDQAVRISCTQDPEFNLLVRKDGQTIWLLKPFFLTFSPGIPLLPGEAEEIAHNWDMKDHGAKPVTPGLYDVVGVMYNAPWNDSHGASFDRTEVAVPVTVIPEPASSILFAVGLAGLILAKNRRRKD